MQSMNDKEKGKEAQEHYLSQADNTSTRTVFEPLVQSSSTKLEEIDSATLAELRQLSPPTELGLIRARSSESEDGASSETSPLLPRASNYSSLPLIQNSSSPRLFARAHSYLQKSTDNRSKPNAIFQAGFIAAVLLIGITIGALAMFLLLWRFSESNETLPEINELNSTELQEIFINILSKQSAVTVSRIATTMNNLSQAIDILHDSKEDLASEVETNRYALIAVGLLAIASFMSQAIAHRNDILRSTLRGVSYLMFLLQSNETEMLGSEQELPSDYVLGSGSDDEESSTQFYTSSF